MQIGPFEAQDQLDEQNELFGRAMEKTWNVAEDSPTPNSHDIRLLPGRYASVQEMVDSCGDPGTSDSFRKHQESRLLINAMRTGRAIAGITDDELSNRTGWCSEDIEDFESSCDADISLRDLRTYSSAIRVQVDINFQAASDDPASLAAIEGINRAVRGDKP